jgi:hypothetical protein
MRIILSVALSFALLSVGVAPLAAQWPSSGQLPEPLLRETPWGDFPLERLLPGARVRLTTADGQRVELRVLALSDSSLQLRAPNGESLPPVTFTALHAYRSIEARVLPAWSDRVGTASVVGGALLGAVAGTIIHNSRKPSSPAVHRLSRLDDIAGASVIGGLVGWEIGIHTLGRPRWRRVTLP